MTRENQMKIVKGYCVLAGGVGFGLFAWNAPWMLVPIAIAAAIGMALARWTPPRVAKYVYAVAFLAFLVTAGGAMFEYPSSWISATSQALFALMLALWLTPQASVPKAGRTSTGALLSP